EAFCDELEDLAFTAGEVGEHSVGLWLGRSEAVEQALKCAWRKEGVAARDEADRVDELGRPDVLEQEAARAGTDCVVYVVVEVEGRQDQDASGLAGGDDAACRLDAVEVGHADVEQDHVGLELAHELDGL